VLSFKPTGPAGHAGLVAVALSAAVGTDVNGKEYRFSAAQIGRAQDGVVGVDHSWRFLFSSYHCDNDDTEQCSNRIVQERADLLQDLRFAASNAASTAYFATPVSCNSVQYSLGQLLHTLQDFYAHSNWVDAHGAVQNSLIGTASPPVACRTCHQCPNVPWKLEGSDAGQLTT